MLINHKIERVGISSMAPHPKNSRFHEDQAIEESLKENGFYKGGGLGVFLTNAGSASELQLTTTTLSLNLGSCPIETTPRMGRRTTD